MKQYSVILSVGIFLISSCSKQKEIALKMDQIELQLQSISNDVKTEERRIEMAFENGETALMKQNEGLIKKLQSELDSLTSEYKELASQFKGKWYEGRDFPFEQILIDLEKEGYDLTDYDNFIPASTETYKRIVFFELPTDYNDEDANKIKNIIMKTLPFEPEVYKNDKTWNASKYDIEMFRTGILKKVGIRFMTK